jgi:hypothetical protein
MKRVRRLIVVMMTGLRFMFRKSDLNRNQMNVSQSGLELAHGLGILAVEITVDLNIGARIKLIVLCTIWTDLRLASRRGTILILPRRFLASQG